MLDETLFLKALSIINSGNYDEKTWLKNNFELFKQTLIWPVNLPPISRSIIKEGSLMLKFNESFYTMDLDRCSNMPGNLSSMEKRKASSPTLTFHRWMESLSVWTPNLFSMATCHLFSILPSKTKTRT